MGILDRALRLLGTPAGPPPRFIANRLTTLPAEVRAVSGDLTGRPWSIGRSVTTWNGTDPGKLIGDAFAKITCVFACATLLGDAVAESPMRVYKEVDGEPKEDPKHPVRAILADPNPRFSEAEFFAVIVGMMAITGYVVLEKIRSSAGLPVELWPLRTSCLKPVHRPDSAPAWQYRVPGNPVRTLEPKDVIVVTYRDDPGLSWTGVSPAQVAAREVGIDNSLTEFLKGLLDNGGIPPIYLESPDPITDPSVRDAIQARWAADYGGAGNWFKVPIFHGGWKPGTLGMDLNQMAWPDLRSLTELRICQGYRVPPHLVFARAAVENGGLSTTEQEQAMRMLQLYAATPLRNRIDGALTRGLLREYTDDPMVTLEFDTSGVKALQEEEDKKAARAREDWNASTITLDEYRQQRGYPPLKNKRGQVFKTKFTDIFLTEDQLGGFSAGQGPADSGDTATRGRPTVRELPPTALGPGPRRYRNVAALSPQERQIRAKAIDASKRDQSKLQEILERKLRAFWKQQGERIVGEVTRMAQRFTGAPERDLVAMQLSDLQLLQIDAREQLRAIADVDWDDELRLLREVLDRFYGACGEAAFATTGTLLGVEIAWDLSNPHIKSVMDQLGHNVKGIADESRTQIQAIVTDGMAEGATLDDITARLEEKFDDWGTSRARTVARTETMIGYGEASVLAYQETNGAVEECEIHDNVAHTERYKGAADGLTCAERDGLVVPLSRVMFHIRSDHPNGSSFASPILATALGEE